MRTVCKNVDRCEQRMWTAPKPAPCKQPSTSRAINGKRYTSDPARERDVEAIKLELLPVNDPARINFVDTADNCGQKMWTDAECPQ